MSQHVDHCPNHSQLLVMLMAAPRMLTGCWWLGRASTQQQTFSSHLQTARVNMRHQNLAANSYLEPANSTLNVSNTIHGTHNTMGHANASNQQPPFNPSHISLGQTVTCCQHPPLPDPSPPHNVECADNWPASDVAHKSSLVTSRLLCYYYRAFILPRGSSSSRSGSRTMSVTH